MYQVEIVWSNTYSFVPHGKEHETIEEAKKYASSLLSMEIKDGASIKKAQIVDLDTGEVVIKSDEISN